MAVSYKKQYTSEAKYIYDLAKSSDLFSEDAYKQLGEKADDYVYAIAGTLTKTADKFILEDYNLLNAKDKLGYLMNEYYVDKSLKNDKGKSVYEQNKEYFNSKIEEAIDLQTYKSLNDFEKVIHTTRGIVGNILNETILGTLEGLIDVSTAIVGIIPSIFDGGEIAKNAIARDVTGVRATRELLQKYSRAYTYIDKSKPVQIINDVTTGLAKMAPMLIPYVGTGIYFGGMAGNTAEEAIIANPDINYAALLSYTGVVTGVEFATEKISAVFFGGSAIDKLMFKTSSTKAGSWIARLGLDFLSEGTEEFVSEIADSVLYTVMVDEKAPIASLSDCLYAGLIGGLIGGISAIGRIATTKILVILEDGSVISSKEAEKLGLTGKKLSKIQSLTLMEQLQTAKNILDTNAISDLQAKYSKLTLDEIQTQHADEFEKASKQNQETQEKLVESTLGLSKILELAGVEGFKKAVDLLNYTTEQRANLIKNYVSKSTGTISQNRSVEQRYKAKFPESSFTVLDDLNTTQQRIKDGIKSEYGIDVFFGDLGTQDGVKRQNGITLDENTIVLDKNLTNTMSIDSIITQVVKEELVHTLQYSSGILDINTINDLMKQYQTLTTKQIKAQKLDESYRRSSELAKLSEAQAKSFAQILLFDKLSVSRIMITNNSTFNKVYKWCNRLKQGIENLKNRKSNKDKVRYRELLNIMNMYRDVVSKKIGNSEDAETAKMEMGLNDEQLQKLLDTFLPDYTTEHYTLLSQSHTIDTEQRLNAEKSLRSNVKGINSRLPLSYRNIFNADYYNESFVNEILTRNPNKDFRYNLQEYMISTYNFTINQQDGCLMEIVDLNKVTTNDFDKDLSDSTKLTKYTKLSDIFDDNFNSKFIDDSGVNQLSDINLKFVSRETNDNTQAMYVRSDPETKQPTITVYLKSGTMSEIENLKHKLFHETTHALADVQGLQNGTSTNYVKSSLIEMNNPALVQKLAKMLLTKEFYEANKTNMSALIDNVSYGIYRITDGEYSAEAYKTSKVREGDLKTQLKAGATMNRSGFRTDGLFLYGYGRFQGIELKANTIVQTKKQYRLENLRKATEVVSYNKGSDLLNDFAKQGITDFEKAGFSDEFVYLLENDKLTENTIWDMINTETIGTTEATNKLIEWLAPENKHIKTIEDVDKVKNLGIAYAKVYGEIRLKNDPQYNIKKTVSFNELEKFIKMNENNAAVMNKVSAEMEKISNLLDKPENSSINSWLIKRDYGYSLNSTNKLLSTLKGYGINSKMATISDTVDVSQKGDTETVSIFDTIASDELTPQEILENKESKTDYDEKQSSVENYIKTIKESISKIGDSKKIFDIRKKIENDKKLLIKSFGEEGYNAILEIAPKSKATYNKQISRLKTKLNQRTDLTQNQKTLIDLDTADFSPSEYEKYIEDLKKLEVKQNGLQEKRKEKEIISEKEIANEFRELQETSRNLLKELETSTKTSRELDEKLRERYTKSIQKQLEADRNSNPNVVKYAVKNEKKGTTFEMNSNVTPKLFHDAFETIKPYTAQNELVDLHDDYAGDNCYLSEDGLQGFAITEDGNLISVFNADPNKRGYVEAIKKLILDSGANHLDCYGYLANYYNEVLGFKVASIMDYNMEYDHHGISEKYNNPDVAFMVLSDTDVVEKRFKGDQYDAAVEHQMSYLKTEKITTNIVPEPQAIIPSETIRTKEPNSVAQGILNGFKNSTTDISKMQYSEATEKTYTKVSYDMINDNAALFTLVNDDNYDVVRNSIIDSKEFYSAQALIVFDLYTMEMKGKFSKETQTKIENNNRQTTTESAQKLALQARRVAERKPITNTINTLAKDGLKATVTDEIIQQYDSKLKDKEAYIKELTDKITSLEKQLKETTNKLEQVTLLQEIKEVSDTKLTIENGTNADIMDMIINNSETLEEAAKIQQEVLKKLVDTAEKAEIENKQIGTFLYDKDGKPKSFPKLRETLAKILKKLKSYRMWAMLSSPVTWVRNWVSNAGMRALDNATNIVERFMTKNTQFGKNISETSLKFNESKAGKDVYDHIADVNGTYIMGLIRGEDVKYEITAEKSADIKRQERKKQYESSNTIQKAFLKAQDLTDWGLSTGPLGDEPVVFKNICKNMGNLVANNTEYLLKGIQNEANGLSSRKDLSDKQTERLNVLNKALQTKSPNDIFDALSKEETERLFSIAKEKSFQQFFKNQNNFTKWCNNLGEKNPVVADIVSWIMPFPKVAANILSMAYKYSPLNFISALNQYSKLKQIESKDYKGRIEGTERAQLIRTLSEASTGTFMLIAGAIAAALGWVDIDDDDYMGPSLMLPGDIKISLSNLAPSMTTFSMASAMIWAWKNDKSALSQALDVLYDNTLLGNIDNIFKYSSTENFVQNLSISYLSQYIPSIAKLLNKFMTNNTYKDKSGNYWNKLIKTLGSYIPGISELVPDKVNPYTGEKVYRSGTDSWWFNIVNAVSPLEIKSTKTTGIEAEAERVGAETTGLSGTFSINGKDIAVTGNTKESLSKFRAEYINEEYSNIISGKKLVTVEDDNGKRITTTYDKLTTTQQQKVLKNLYSKSTEITKIKYWIEQDNYYIVTDKDLYNTYKKLFNNSKNILYKNTWSKSKFIER